MLTHFASISVHKLQIPSVPAMLALVSSPLPAISFVTLKYLRYVFLLLSENCLVNGQHKFQEEYCSTEMTGGIAACPRTRRVTTRVVCNILP